MAHAGDELILVGLADAVGQALAHTGAGAGEQRSFTVTHANKSMKFALVKAGAPARQALGQVANWARGARAAVMAEDNGTVSNPRLRGKQKGAWSLDPWNWVTDPWDWVDDPWDWVDDPWDWVDDPAAAAPVAAAGTSAADAQDKFRKQRAFLDLGLNDANGERNPVLAGIEGAGVLVGLFDAIPNREFTKPWLTIHKGHGQVQSGNASVDLSDHGILCASLVNAVAPAAKVHLYQVCGQDGQGELFPLLEAINEFIDLAAGKPAIISLSLGSQDATGSAALRALLQKATDLGMVVCAAAGNLAKRATKTAAIQSAQVPAAFPNVIAVAAANKDAQRASYSQRGDLAAPGGEDREQPGPDDDEDMIGLGISVGDTGYVRMDAGTSFATPLVAGAAALLLEGASLNETTHDVILAKLKAGARLAPAAGEETPQHAGLGAGILYLPNLFNH